MTTASLSYRAISSKVQPASMPRLKIRWKIAYAVGILLLLTMLVSYIYLVDQLTKGAYLIKSYDKQINTLSLQNKTLETSFAESGFLGQALDKVDALGFQKASDITYVQILSTSLAEAK